MKNVTIVLEERVADWARIEAARRRTSISRMVGEMLAEKMRHEQGYQKAMREFMNLKSKKLRRSSAEKFPARTELYRDEHRLRG